jgi:hypothetical protein
MPAEREQEDDGRRHVRRGGPAQHDGVETEFGGDGREGEIHGRAHEGRHEGCEQRHRQGGALEGASVPTPHQDAPAAEAAAGLVDWEGRFVTRSLGQFRPRTQVMTPAPFMNPLSKTGVTIVVFALAAYTMAVAPEQRRRLATPRVLMFLTVGVLLDVTGTIFLILGPRGGAWTLHGVLGYSSLAVMIIDTWLMWRLAASAGPGTDVPRGLHLYTRAAYLWWVAAFITGGLLVPMR